MNVRKRIAIGVATAALAGGATAGGAIGSGVATAAGDSQAAAHTAAVAQRAPSNCPKGYLCVYPEANYKGAVKKVAQNNLNLKRYGGAFDTPFSAYNHGSSCNVVVYEKTGYHGRHYKLNRGTGWTYIGSNLLSIYSNKWVDCS